MLNIRDPNVRTAALVIIGIAYLFLGALIFQYLEGGHEDEAEEIRIRQETYIREKYNISMEDIRILRQITIDRQKTKHVNQWHFTGSLYFALIVLTTIGYGHSVPYTRMGKLACMFYALIGVPLYLVMFQAMGERINNAQRYLIKWVGRRFDINCLKHAPLAVQVLCGLSWCFLTIGIGTFVFSYYEDWSLLDSGYYCVITLTTIGFGDFVPLLKNGSLQDHPSYVGFSMAYIITGLTVIGAFVNLIIVRVMVTASADEPSTADESDTTSNVGTPGCAGDAEEGERNRMRHNPDKDGVFLPNTNGDVRTTQSTPRKITDLDWFKQGKLSRWNQRSLVLPREEKSRSSFVGNSRTTQHGEGEFFTVCGEIQRKNQTTHQNQTTRVGRILPTDNCPIPVGGEFIMHRKTRTMSHDDLQNFEKDFATRYKQTLLSTDGKVGFTNKHCVICQRSCPVCSSIFSNIIRFGGAGDAGEHHDVIPVGASFDNKNGNNNSVHANSQGSKTNTEYTVECNSDTPGGTHVTTTCNNKGINSPASICNQPILKSLLDPNAQYRQRNHSLDSGYEGMVSPSPDEKFNEFRRFQESQSMNDLSRLGRRSRDFRDMGKFGDNIQRHFEESQAKLIAPSPWSKRETSAILEHTASFATSSESCISSSSFPTSEYVTLANSGKSCVEDSNPSTDVDSVIRTVPAEMKSSVLPVHEKTCQSSSPSATPAIVVTGCEEETRKIAAIGENGKPSIVHDKRQQSRSPPATNSQHPSDKSLGCDKSSNECLKNNICLWHWRDMQRLRYAFPCEAYDDPISTQTQRNPGNNEVKKITPVKLSNTGLHSAAKDAVYMNDLCSNDIGQTRLDYSFSNDFTAATTTTEEKAGSSESNYKSSEEGRRRTDSRKEFFISSHSIAVDKIFRTDECIAGRRKSYHGDRRCIAKKICRFNSDSSLHRRNPSSQTCQSYACTPTVPDGRRNAGCRYFDSRASSKLDAVSRQVNSRNEIILRAPAPRDRE